jgi:hypothetical protein
MRMTRSPDGLFQITLEEDEGSKAMELVHDFFTSIKELAESALRKPKPGEVPADSYRFVICVDVEAKSLTQAYGKVYEAMNSLDDQLLGWESTDEVYDPLGNAYAPSEIQTAVDAYYSRGDLDCMDCAETLDMLKNEL